MREYLGNVLGLLAKTETINDQSNGFSDRR
jgi:hypothetical protein